MFHHHLDVGFHSVLYRVAWQTTSLFYSRTQQIDQRSDMTCCFSALDRRGNGATMLMAHDYQQSNMQVFGAVFQATEFYI